MSKDSRDGLSMDAQIIKVTSKGQIAIPVGIRKELSIMTGDSLVAYVFGDTIMLKTLKLPDEDDFRKVMDEAQKYAKANGLKESDVNEAIKDYRRNKKL